jgi:hypothetical protein
LMLLADWTSKSQHPQHTIAKTESGETDGRERETRGRESVEERGGDSNVKTSSSG